MRVGLFGGTFDPIHNGHLHLALSLQKAHHLDQILFCPANYSPGKENKRPVADREERKKMVSLALEPFPSFSVLEVELNREGPSYTIDTVRELKKERPEDEFFLILGEDILSDLPHWKEPLRLLELAPPLVGTRNGSQPPRLPEEIQKKILPGMTPIAPMEISSTQIRKNFAQGKDCHPFIPPKVLDYIRAERVY